ncbi:hypothetical protein PHMEG_00032998 [Phytophthora megakarya]|uniref:Uncharacterized protein n=1 Tax=Phytophthora megakarya TaxID=4795 RepID=A0A225UVA1_9STRA|nr:hypothetical protein PHMEG_00032998 [Phytophthora megakarya]
MSPRNANGRTVPPGIRYDWPFGKPDSQAYYSATLQTSRYLEQRMSVASQAGAWISELRVRRNTFVSDGQTSKSAVMVDDYPEDQDGDAVMTTQEAQLLGQTGYGVRTPTIAKPTIFCWRTGTETTAAPTAASEHVVNSVSVHTSVIPIFGCDDSRCQARGPKCKFHEESIRVQLWDLSSNGRFG